MDNPFAGLKQTTWVTATDDPLARKLLDQDHKQKRDALYAEYTPMVYNVLDQLIVACRPGVWKKGSDCNHKYCCHCRWYAGPEETGHANYDDHVVRRRIEIELEINGQCGPTGFNVRYHDEYGKCVHVGLSQEELVRGIKAVWY